MFFKRMFKEYVVVIESKNKYRSMGMDQKLIKYIGNKEINYIVIKENNEIEIYECLNNKYRHYMYIEFLMDVIDKYKERNINIY